MSEVTTAAFDPIFWAHHSNIDRLWADWDCLTAPVRTWGGVPPREWLDEKAWSFYDVDKTVKNNPRLYYVDRRNLAIRYDTDSSSCAPLSATDPRAVITAMGPPVKFAVKAEVARVATQVQVTPDRPETVSVPLTSIPSLGNLKVAIVSAPATARRRVSVELGNVMLEGITSVGFDVFANLTGNRVPNRLSPNYLGTIPVFGHGHHGSSTQSFDLTRLVRLTDFNPRTLAVSVVPFDPLTPRDGAPRLRRPFGLRFQQLRVIVHERA